LFESIVKIVKAHPHEAFGVIIFLIVCILFYFRRRVIKNKRKSSSYAYFCKKNQRVVLDGVDSFYISNSKVTYTVTISDLVARSIIDEKNSKCPGGGAFVLSIKRDDRGRLFDATVTCSKHGVCRMSD